MWVSCNMNWLRVLLWCTAHVPLLNGMLISTRGVSQVRLTQQPSSICLIMLREGRHYKWVIKGGVSSRFSDTWKSSEGVGINLKCSVLITKWFKTVMAMDKQERIGLGHDNVWPTFSSLTMLLRRKSLNIIDLLQIEFMISECTFMILAKFAQKLKRLFVILPP